MPCCDSLTQQVAAFMGGVHDNPNLSRRTLLKQIGAAPLVFRAAPLLAHLAATKEGQAPSTLADAAYDFRVTPRYPALLPLEDVIRHVQPGSDEFPTEKYAFEISATLGRWSQALAAGNIGALGTSFHPAFLATSFQPVRETLLRKAPPFNVRRRHFSNEANLRGEAFLKELRDSLGKDAGVEYANFDITSIKEVSGQTLAVEVDIRYDIVLSSAEAYRSQAIGYWKLTWACRNAATGSPEWLVTRWRIVSEVRSSATAPLFEDVTDHAFREVDSYKSQLLYGADHWRSVLDGACGIDVYGNNGVAVGDYDGDGFDDLYVSQPAGLPNRLYRNRGDGTFEDVTTRAGVGVLDNTACALFADFRNSGLQDLLVVCGSGPLLFINNGDGTYTRKPEAFQFQSPPQGTFTHAAIADYDLDGRLDVYFCVYSYYLGLDQYHYPVPYFDARNGPPNFLFHNAGDGTFHDRTAVAGLSTDNDRYSFACAWGPSATGRYSDLYVVNDFGRNVLYRNVGNGTFTAASSAANVEDVGAGMSACWADTSNSLRSDLYTADMWSAAGKRISAQSTFHPDASPEVKSLYQRHADGNALYLSRGSGVFQNMSEQAGVACGRWAWASDFWDFDHDGYADLYVTNGYITSPDASGSPLDLGSFFWRQVVGKSPDDTTSSQPYERGWNALNELIRSDRSWSGHERNVMFANNYDGTFSEVSGIAGLNLVEDGRSFALADFDGDGRLEIALKNRNAPQLRVLKNVMKDIADAVCIRLVGVKSNRDAVGAAVIIHVGTLRQKKYLQAGSGFLSQHTKDIFFGLGEQPGPVDAIVEWPSGQTQRFPSLPRNSRITVTEGSANFLHVPFSEAPAGTSKKRDASVLFDQVPKGAIETWLIDPLPAIDFSLRDGQGKLHGLHSSPSRLLLLLFCPRKSLHSQQSLHELQRKYADLTASGLSALAISIEPEEQQEQGSQLLSFPMVAATDEIVGTYNIVYRYLFDRRRDLPVPTSFLLDGERNIVKVYQGKLNVDSLSKDLRKMPAGRQERLKRALPFPGVIHEADFKRNDFTFGVAMFQHGYLKQAEALFEQVVAARPTYAEGFYNLGTLSLRRGDFARARDYLKQALQLKADYPEAWNNLGMMAAQNGNNGEAVENFRRSLALRPKYGVALLNLGNALRRQGDASHAEEALSQAQALLPNDAEASYSLGLLYAQQGDVLKAEDFLRRSLVLRPVYPEAGNNLGVLYVRVKEYAKAEAEFTRAVELAPKYVPSYMNLARLYVLQGRRADARKALENLLVMEPGNAAAMQALETVNRVQ